MWAAHYLFHFFTGALTIVPLFQSFVYDLTGRALLGVPDWRLACLLSLQTTGDLVVVVLGLGAAGSLLWTLWLGREEGFTLAALLPWIVVHASLFLFGVWLLGQPMEMRGTLLG
jgi:hypothetical protein